LAGLKGTIDRKAGFMSAATKPSLTGIHSLTAGPSLTGIVPTI